MPQHAARGRQERGEGDAHSRHAERSVGHGDACQGEKQAFPFRSVARLLGAAATRGVSRHAPHGLRQGAFQPAVGRCGGTYHVRGEERSDDAHRHHHGIEEVGGHVERNAEGGEDKGKFTDLRQRETTLHRHAQWLPRKQETRRAEYGLPHDDGHADSQYWQPVFRQYGGVDHHAHGDEEDSAEEVLHRSRDALYALRLDRLGQDTAHHERAERAAIARLRRYHDQEEAQPHADHQQRLAVHPPPRAPQEQWH